ncbi:hypothetical protein H8E77_28530 [bacterium]|nr:hypothetical protein [bacterium]
MPPQLANPAAWIEPTLRQAWADFMVANHLVTFPLDDELHKGQPAYHAAMAKYQQALEKALSTLLLQFLPSRSDLVFVHCYLTDATIWNQADVRRALLRVFQVNRHIGNLRLPLQAVERLVPDVQQAELDDSGRCIRLAENAEYPYTDAQGNPVAPCDTFATIFVQRFLNIQKNLSTLFKALRSMPEFRYILHDVE